MKSSTVLWRFKRAVLLTLATFTIPGYVQAQTTQTWGGGSNTWDLKNTHDWSGSTVWNGGDDDANFTTAAGTVTVDNSSGQVTVDSMVFNNGGTTIIQGGTLDENPFTTINS